MKFTRLERVRFINRKVFQFIGHLKRKHMLSHHLTGSTEEMHLSMVEHPVSARWMLSLVGAPEATQDAAMLHDLFEPYIDDDEWPLEERRRWVIEKAYDGNAQLGLEVLRLVDANTEPWSAKCASTPECWWVRKNAVLAQIEAGDQNVALVNCAVKITGLDNADQFRRAGKTISSWSSGTLEDNIAFHEKLLELYISKDVHPELLVEFKRGLENLRSWTG